MARSTVPPLQSIIARAREQGYPPILLRFAGSIVAGVMSALSLALLASQRISTIDAETAVTALLFIQWQILGVTVAKLGVDQVVFAVVSRDTALQFSYWHFLSRKATPLSLVAGLVIGYLFSSPIIGAMAGMSVLLDTFSTMVSADLNARKAFGTTAIGALLNYPVFVVLVLALAGVGPGAELVIFLFLVSSLCRALWLYRKRHRRDATNEVRFRGAATLAAQQSFNYVLFRWDQLLLVLIAAVGLHISHGLTIDQYVYLGKFPELVASGLVIVGLYVFPHLRIDGSAASAVRGVRLTTFQVILGACIALLVIGGFTVYQSSWLAPELMGGPSSAVVIPFAIQALLILPVNGITYLFMGDGHVRHLVRLELSSVALAGVISIIALIQGSLALLAWAVPVQLALFIVGGLLLKPNSDKRVNLYD